MSGYLARMAERTLVGASARPRLPSRYEGLGGTAGGDDVDAAGRAGMRPAEEPDGPGSPDLAGLIDLTDAAEDRVDGAGVRDAESAVGSHPSARARRGRTTALGDGPVPDPGGSAATTSASGGGLAPAVPSSPETSWVRATRRDAARTDHGPTSLPSELAAVPDVSGARGTDRPQVAVVRARPAVRAVAGGVSPASTPAPRPSTLPVPTLPTAPSAAAEPVVRVSIGRLEVRAALAPVPEPRPAPAPSRRPGEDLHAYLRGHRGAR